MEVKFTSTSVDHSRGFEDSTFVSSLPLLRLSLPNTLSTPPLKRGPCDTLRRGQNLDNFRASPSPPRMGEDERRATIVKQVDRELENGIIRLACLWHILLTGTHTPKYGATRAECGRSLLLNPRQTVSSPVPFLSYLTYLVFS